MAIKEDLLQGIILFYYIACTGEAAVAAVTDPETSRFWR
jgi:hypothetical protein